MSVQTTNGVIPSALGPNLTNEETAGAVVIGDVEKVPRTTGFLEIISVAFNLLSSWLAVASTLILGLSHGGSVTVLYGLFIILVMYGAVALTLAELAARYTTAGGQYHWTALLAPKSMKRGLVNQRIPAPEPRLTSYTCGSINVIGRIAMIASIDIIVAQLFLAMLAFNLSAYQIQRWHVFLSYQVLNVINTLYNLLALKRTPWTHNIGSYIKLTNDHLGVPVWALAFNAFWLLILGCIYMVSTSGFLLFILPAFNVFIGAAMLTELISFTFPAALLMWRGRHVKYLPSRKSLFHLGKFGWLANAIVVGWTLFALVIFSFPIARPVTPGSMNYTSVVLAIMMALSILNWLFYARKRYQGPNVTLFARAVE
ncbi:MAG: hypothetical protein Q9173_004295 [Seirophora scorigena]